MATQALAAFAQLCNQCAICSGTCPKARVKPGFLPRRIVYNVLNGNASKLIDSGIAWHCLTCKQCQARCPMGVDFTAIIRELRRAMLEKGNGAVVAHANMLGPSLFGMMENEKLKPKHRDFLAKDVKIGEGEDVLYFMGCTAILDFVFRDDVGFEGLDVANNSIRLMNAAGVEPTVLDAEKCCGHDQLWRGEAGDFEKLARQNAELLKDYKTIVVSCPECYRALAVDYKEKFGVKLNVKHISEFLLEKGLGQRTPNGNATRTIATYHDSCRLGRYMGVYDEPRKLLSAFGYELKEMAQNRDSALCCGVPQYVNCDDENKKIRRNRMNDAVATGASVMVTPCMKCQIHLKCLQRDASEKTEGRAYPVEIVDFTTALARKLTKEVE